MKIRIDSKRRQLMKIYCLRMKCNALGVIRLIYNLEMSKNKKSIDNTVNRAEK